MKFYFELTDRLGKVLSEGDIVMVSGHGFGRRQISFYAEVKYIAEKNLIHPFDTFSYSSFEKVDKVPDNAILKQTDMYRYWFVHDPIEDPNGEEMKTYLFSYQDNEKLRTSAYKVYKVESHGKQQFLF